MLPGRRSLRLPNVPMVLFAHTLSARLKHHAISIIVATWLALLTMYTARQPWVALTGGNSAATVNGYTLEWEWIDVGQSALFIEGNPWFHVRGGAGALSGSLTDQNAARMTPALVVSILGAFFHWAWLACLVATWVAWMLTWQVMDRLTIYVVNCTAGSASPTGLQSARTVTTILVCTSPGFLAFAGNIDIHQFGYLSAPVGLLAIRETICRLDTKDPENISGNRHFTPRFGALIALTLFLVDGVMQLAIPLLAVLILTILAIKPWKLFRAHVITIGPMFAGYVALLVIWAVIARAGSNGTLVAHNEARARFIAALSNPPLEWFQIIGQVLLTCQSIFDVYSMPHVIIGMIGLLMCWRRGGGLLFIYVIIIMSAVNFTLLHPRTIYLTFPGIYIGIAAWAIVFDRLANRWMPAAVNICFTVVIGCLPLVLNSLKFINNNLQTSQLWWPKT